MAEQGTVSKGTPSAASSASASDSTSASGKMSASGSASTPESIDSRFSKLYQDAESRMLRMEAAQKRSDPSILYDFTPRTNHARPGHKSSSKKLSKSVSPQSSEKRKEQQQQTGKIGDRLYEGALAQRQRMQEKVDKAAVDKQRSRKPRINTSSQSSTAQQLKGQERINKMYQAGKTKYLGLKNHMKPLEAECTFRPQTNSNRPKQISSPRNMDKQSLKSKSPSHKTVATPPRLAQLYEQGKKTQIARREAAAEAASIQPRHTSSSSPRSVRSGSASLPGSAAAATRLSPSREQMDSMRLEQETRRASLELQGCTFRPQTLRDSQSPVRTDVHMRLYQDAQEAEERREIARELLMQKEEEEQTFHPRVSSQIVSDEPVFDRLYEHGLAWTTRRVEDDIGALQRREELDWERNEPDCTFKPQISDLAQLRALDSEDGVVFDRLHGQALERLEKREWNVIERQGLDGECTFYPNINLKSRELAAAHVGNAGGGSGNTHVHRTSLEDAGALKVTCEPSLMYSLGSGAHAEGQSNAGEHMSKGASFEEMGMLDGHSDTGSVVEDTEHSDIKDHTASPALHEAQNISAEEHVVVTDREVSSVPDGESDTGRVVENRDQCNINEFELLDVYVDRHNLTESQELENNSNGSEVLDMVDDTSDSCPTAFQAALKISALDALIAMPPAASDQVENNAEGHVVEVASPSSGAVNNGGESDISATNPAVAKTQIDQHEQQLQDVDHDTTTYIHSTLETDDKSVKDNNIDTAVVSDVEIDGEKQLEAKKGDVETEVEHTAAADAASADKKKKKKRKKKKNKGNKGKQEPGNS